MIVNQSFYLWDVEAVSSELFTLAWDLPQVDQCQTDARLLCNQPTPAWPCNQVGVRKDSLIICTWTLHDKPQHVQKTTLQGCDLTQQRRSSPHLHCNNWLSFWLSSQPSLLILLSTQHNQPQKHVFTEYCRSLDGVLLYKCLRVHSWSAWNDGTGTTMSRSVTGVNLLFSHLSSQHLTVLHICLADSIIIHPL